MGERLYSRRQAADLLKVHYSSVRRWEQGGRLQVASYAVKGRRREPRFTREELDRIREELAAEGGLSEDMSPTREVEALRAENELLRADLGRERSLVDRLLEQERVLQTEQ